MPFGFWGQIETKKRQRDFDKKFMGGVFLCSQFSLPCFSGSGNTKFRIPTVPLLKDILDGPLPFASTRNLAVSSKQTGGDTDGASPRRSSRGKTPRGNELEGKGKQLSKDPKEVISLFKKIQSSISKGSVTTNNVPPVESVLEVLRQSTAKGKAARKKGDEILPRKEHKTDDMLSTDTKSARLPSKFIRRSPIPPSNQGLEDDKDMEIPETKEDVSQKLKEMKVAELKELAKARGIKGYSKLRKPELLKLLMC